MPKAGRPKRVGPEYIELGLRATKPEYDLIQEATKKNAARLHVIPSRNNFCLRAALAAAKKELGIVDESVESDDDLD